LEPDNLKFVDIRPSQSNSHKGIIVPLNLRKAIVRNVIVSTAVCFVLSMALSLFSGGAALSLAQLAWPIALALGIGMVSGWLMITKIKNGVLKSIPAGSSYATVDRAAYPDFDWQSIDDYAIQLQARGFVRLGDYTSYPAFTRTTGVAACFLDSAATTLVEVQHMQMRQAQAGMPADLGQVHFSIFSVLAGKIPVFVSDRTLIATNYLIRGDLDVAASFPGLPLLSLLEKHTRLRSYLQEHIGKATSGDLNLARYIILMRERFEQARRRIESKNGFFIAQQIDAFEADPKTNWSPAPKLLAELSPRPMIEVDTSAAAKGQPPIVQMQQPDKAQLATGGATKTAEIPAVSATMANENSAQVTALQQRLESGANWFYWIAGLSLVNAVTAAFGSDWAFVIGLGISQILSGVANAVRGTANASFVFTGILWILNFAVVGFFAACGWFARRPSNAAFIVGITLFAMDSLIFLLAADWIGVIFHAVALFYLWNGFTAGREVKRMQGSVDGSLGAVAN
jgi:hypothetical protein